MGPAIKFLWPAGRKMKRLNSLPFAASCGNRGLGLRITRKISVALISIYKTITRVGVCVKLTVVAVGTVSGTKAGIAARVTCIGDQNFALKDIDAPRCIFQYGQQQFPCSIAPTVSKQRDRSFQLTLKFARRFEIWSAFYHLVYKSGLDIPLIVNTQTPPDQLHEATLLLATVARETGKDKADILAQVTSFPDGRGGVVAGKRELKHVSARQMPIVLYKLKEITINNNRPENRKDSSHD
jgi:hypothetical protein